MKPERGASSAEIAPLVVHSGEILGPADPATKRIDRDRLSDAAIGLIDEALAENTRRTYRDRLDAFSRWAVAEGVAERPCSSAALVNYAAHLAESGQSPATIKLATTAVLTAHEMLGLPRPDSRELTDLLKSHTRRWADAGNRTRKARVLRPGELRAVARACPDTPKGLRDRAFVLAAFQTGRRFSELARLGLDEIRADERGLLYYIRRTKTTQGGAGAKWQRLDRNLDGGLCVVSAVLAWRALLDERGITEGPLFRSVDRHGRIGGGTLTRQGGIQIWRSAIQRAELDPTGVSTHSGRRSAVTAGHRAGRSAVELADRFGYERGSRVMLGYIDEAVGEDTDPMAGLL